MNTKFENYEELNDFDMIDTYYNEIKDYKYFIDQLQENRVESQKYIVNANKEIERLNNIIERMEEDLREMYMTFGEFNEEYTEKKIRELKEGIK